MAPSGADGGDAHVPTAITAIIDVQPDRPVW